MAKTKAKTLQWVAKPDDASAIDDAFWVKRQRWGTFVSVNPNGKEIITALTEGTCIEATRWFLKSLQENAFGDNTGVTYTGTVDGKLK
jgi:hypothetical protein